MSREAVVRAFELQGVWGEALGSPFTGAIMRAAVADLAAGGPVAALVGDWPGEPLADALAARFTGALHAAVLSGRDAALAAEYPGARADWDIARIWPLARDFLAREQQWVRDFLQGPPQTNETRRAIALLPGFLQVARHGPLHLLELGASAGLNQNWDKFRYETSSWRWGENNGAVISAQWSGPAPDLDARVHVASRAGCDRNPLDVRSETDMQRLRAFIWADQAERMTRLDAAIAIARAANVRIEQADAGAWLEQKLAGPLPEGVTVIYHSIVWQYVAEASRKRARAAIHDAGARADAGHRVAWLRFEPNLALGLDGPLDETACLLEVWPGAERRVLARSDGHATKVAAGA